MEAKSGKKLLAQILPQQPDIKLHKALPFLSIVEDIDKGFYGKNRFHFDDILREQSSRLDHRFDGDENRYPRPSAARLQNALSNTQIPQRLLLWDIPYSFGLEPIATLRDPVEQPPHKELRIAIWRVLMELNDGRESLDTGLYIHSGRMR